MRSFAIATFQRLAQYALATFLLMIALAPTHIDTHSDQIIDPTPYRNCAAALHLTTDSSTYTNADTIAFNRCMGDMSA